MGTLQAGFEAPWHSPALKQRRSRGLQPLAGREAGSGEGPPHLRGEGRDIVIRFYLRCLRIAWHHFHSPSHEKVHLVHPMHVLRGFHPCIHSDGRAGGCQDNGDIVACTVYFPRIPLLERHAIQQSGLDFILIG